MKFSILSESLVKSKKRVSLLRKLWKANSLDLILDFSLTLLSVVFNYASPFFLNKILGVISETSASEIREGNPSHKELRAQAYIYAVLAFLCTILKSQADVNHLWLGSRAAARLKLELMSTIYAKALKRKDFSGITHHEGDSSTKPKNEDEPKKKVGADKGKIVNLMSGDVGRISSFVPVAYLIYVSMLHFEFILANAPYRVLPSN